MPKREEHDISRPGAAKEVIREIGRVEQLEEAEDNSGSIVDSAERKIESEEVVQSQVGEVVHLREKEGTS